MDENACAFCGASNSATAARCRQCQFPFAPSPSREPVAAGSVGAVHEGFELSRRRVSHAEPQQLHIETPRLRRTFSLKHLIVAGAVVATAVGGWLGWKVLFAGFPFPDRVGGESRMDSELAEYAARFATSSGSLADLDVEIALYGTSVMEPRYIVAVMDLPDGETIESFIAKEPPPPGTDIYAMTHEETFCIAEGSFCGWVEDETMVSVAAPGGDIDHTRYVTDGLRRSVS